MGTSAGMSHRHTASGAEDAAKRASDSHWIDRLARMGLSARGVVYLLVGWFAIQIALGHSTRQASRQGAFHAIASKSWGPALLWLMAIGFFGYALWRLTEGIWGHADGDSTAKKAGKRLFSLGRGVFYAFIGYSAAALAMGSNSGSSGGGSDKTAKNGSAKLLATSYGRPLLIAIGIGFIVGGAVLAWRGLKTKFEKKLKTEQMSAGMRSFVEKVGMAGKTARGVIAALIGIFLVQAAVTFDPKKAKGLDGSLRTLAQNGWGKALLVAIALGLLAFGVYSFAEARYRRTGKEKGSGSDGSGAAAYPASSSTWATRASGSR